MNAPYFRSVRARLELFRAVKKELNRDLEQLRRLPDDFRDRRLIVELEEALGE